MIQIGLGRLVTGRRWTFGTADFWRLWYAGMIAFVVRWVETLAVAIFVFQHTGSPFAVALVTMLRLLPMGLFGAFLGAAAERMERRTVLLGMILMLLVTDVALAALAISGRLAVWHVAVGSFANGIAWAADNPVRRAAMGEVIGSERMGAAMSIDIAANNGSRMLGPAIGGLLLATSGIQGVFIVGVVLYATSFIAALGLRYRNRRFSPVHVPVLSGIAEGLHLAAQDKRLLGTLVVTIIYNLFAWPFTSMVPVIAQQHLELGPASTGVLASMDGLGALLGAVVVAVLVRPRHYGRVYLGGIIIYAAMLTAFALMPSPLPAGAALFLEGFGGSGYSITQTTLIYLYAPPDMRSRMLGLLSVCIGVGPIGFLHLGLLANAIGAQWATVVTGIETLLALALTRPLWRAL
ncbi:MAG TPA: MFS transporter [Acetobacteraceae bacterium]